ncbi:hypothetical protein LOC67_17895 [Stieleria sp. JC731]|uniref:hypothetical protein n=1 Tax=Pirellulaceae TaxID=2691357 RepID=UPI001E400FE1|nr:hypothetical protein [Stieleria sp. JC731]MCC9602426.1 hypothetical protein [Stieleria sp. JC731]
MHWHDATLVLILWRTLPIVVLPLAILFMDKEINVLALVKGEEKFIFLFDDANRDQTLRQLARYAANPELDFSWYDAAMLSRKIRDAVPTDDDLMIDNELDNLSLEDFK